MSNIIELPEIVNREDIQGVMLDFLRDPSGYLTLDLYDTHQINQSGLDLIVSTAFALQGRRGNMQLINVTEETHPILMNANVLGKRLINLADIYTDREEMELGMFFGSLCADSHKYGVTVDKFRNIVKVSRELYNNLHRAEKLFDNEELGIMEYGLIECIRFIENNNPKSLDYLGYRYGEIDKIKVIVEHPFTQNNQQLNLEEGLIYTGVCTRWIDGKGFGFIRPDGMETDVFVHRTQCPWRKESGGYGLIENYTYSFKVEETKKGWQAIDVNRLEGY